MAGERTAVIGVGQTQHTPRAPRRLDGRASSARPRARRSTTPGSTGRDIDAVVIGKAPDMFEGVVMPELYLADALGAVGKPMIRVHTAGSVGGSTAIVAAKLVAVGRPRACAHGRVREAVREQRDVGARRCRCRSRRRSSPAPAATSRR